MDIMKDSKKIMRRRHSAELKARVLRRSPERRASVALSHGSNANVVHKWVTNVSPSVAFE